MKARRWRTGCRWFQRSLVGVEAAVGESEDEGMLEARPPGCLGGGASAHTGRLLVAQVKGLDLRPRPLGLPKELQRRLDARIVTKAADGDLLRQVVPAAAPTRSSTIIFRVMPWRGLLGCDALMGPWCDWVSTLSSAVGGSGLAAQAHPPAAPGTLGAVRERQSVGSRRDSNGWVCQRASRRRRSVSDGHER